MKIKTKKIKKRNVSNHCVKYIYKTLYFVKKLFLLSHLEVFLTITYTYLQLIFASVSLNDFGHTGKSLQLIVSHKHARMYIYV